MKSLFFQTNPPWAQSVLYKKTKTEILFPHNHHVYGDKCQLKQKWKFIQLNCRMWFLALKNSINVHMQVRYLFDSSKKLSANAVRDNLKERYSRRLAMWGKSNLGVQQCRTRSRRRRLTLFNKGFAFSSHSVAHLTDDTLAIKLDLIKLKTSHLSGKPSNSIWKECRCYLWDCD